MQCTASSVCWNGLKIGLFSVFYIKVNKESKLIWSNLIAEASKELPLCIQQITVKVHLMVLAIRWFTNHSESLIYKLVAELYVKHILQLVVWYQPLIILTQETGHFHLWRRSFYDTLTSMYCGSLPGISNQYLNWHKRVPQK